MKTLHFISSGLVGLALLLQFPTTPPMRMGLWETTSNVKMSGVEMPQGMSMPNMTTKVRSCLTPESYAKALGNSERQKDCVRSNEVWTSNHFAFDLACKSGNATGHFDMTFESKESGHGAMHLSMNPGGNHAMQMDSTMDMHFVSADCGAISPDKPQVIR